MAARKNTPPSADDQQPADQPGDLVTEPEDHQQVQPSEPAVPFLSEGVRLDLVNHGKATDPATGIALVRDPDTEEITVAPRQPAQR